MSFLQIEPPREDVWKMFDQISATYDISNRILSMGIDIYWRRKLSQFIPNKEHLKLLDLATGTADQIIAILNKKKSIETAIGIDLANEMLHVGSTKILRKPYAHKVSLIEGDATNLTFTDESVDLVTMSFGIRNIDNPLICMQEMHRVLTKHGRALILEFSLPKHPKIRPLYLFYLRKILPKIGKLMSKHQQAYEYLNRTIETFPYGSDFVRLLQEAGFQQISFYPLTFGIATLYVADKHLE